MRSKGAEKRVLPDLFYEWQNKCSIVKSNSDKLLCLNNMLKHIPRGDDFNKVRGSVSHRIKELKEKIVHKENQEIRIRESRSVKWNEDLPTIGLLGPPNSGKSEMINYYCSTNHASTLIPFETKNPAFGVAPFEDIKLQFIEIPSDLNPRYVEMLHKTDLVIITGFEKERFLNLLQKHGIATKVMFLAKEGKPYSYPQLSELWHEMDLIRVYPKGDKTPVLLKKGDTVLSFIKSIHSSWVDRFKTAVISGFSVKYKKQNVNLNHVLADKDEIEVKLND